ncbi:hypothetical protein PanWU01x14_318490 [Parasponia andersonii]|uniref:Uncharacterized protein n=1 Tax=Parasponia andersonii TaxID=3476 RepID=A0A2P5AML7_PARAD|nr:hypothetical protein PanWU01x14_318490 [Parasponia andersonii]
MTSILWHRSANSMASRCHLLGIVMPQCHITELQYYLFDHLGAVAPENANMLQNFEIMTNLPRLYKLSCTYLMRDDWEMKTLAVKGF